MRVLSLFDGMGCGMIALRELGIEPEVYYASEIDKYAIMQTSRNFPNVIHVGDVRELDASKLGRIDCRSHKTYIFFYKKQKNERVGIGYKGSW